MKYLHKSALGIGVLLVALVVFARVAQAQSFQTGDNVNLSPGQTIDSSLYAAGQTLTIAGTINGDVFCAGQNVVISGTVHGDVLCAGQTINISGTVDGNVRLAGQAITLDGKVNRNASVAGQTLTVNRLVAGDLSFVGNTMTLNGIVGRDVALAANSAVINNQVGRNIQAHTTNLSFGDQAHVAGTVNYTSENDATVTEGAVVPQLTRSTPSQTNEPTAMTVFGLQAAGILYALFSGLFCALILVLLFPGIFRRTSDEPMHRLGWVILTGFLGSIALPVLAFIFAITAIGLPLGFLTVAGWLFLSLLSFPVAAYYLARKIFPGIKNAIGLMLMGSLILIALLLIPFIGFIAGLAAYWIGLGSLLLTLYHRLPQRSYKTK